MRRMSVGARVGASLMASATAWADSSAGRMPSVRARVLVAASVAHYAIGRLTEQGCGARWSRPERERRNGTGLLLGSSW